MEFTSWFSVEICFSRSKVMNILSMIAPPAEDVRNTALTCAEILGACVMESTKYEVLPVAIS